ncbi:hypothetical protein SAMN02745229_02185 [Butyrivibrio fibrisolvens DSM 3071]|uniref:Uncharacterized protein n=1 Tax=Butyrivibrio fibrisolvens DSM 3071 TaxID=1121131 RepID=A0A1M5ZE36_BUTFI|nr:hypothetical protein [Butyrivibrio fibrisolvens]SHI22434.1 hypothetical protein SAMN02745229_02185 [Butyrivibrio fibrisolvens DSM 3071]
MKDSKEVKKRKKSLIIPIVYIVYIPLSFYLFVYLSAIGSANVLPLYIIDLVKILVIMLFSHYILKTCTHVNPKSNPSKYFIMFAGFCLLEFVYTICRHGKFYYGISSFIAEYVGFLVLEIIIESIGVYKIHDDYNEDIKNIWLTTNVVTAGNFIVLMLYCVASQNQLRSIDIVFAIMAVCSLLFREIGRYRFLRSYINRVNKA